ncbi:MAG: beta-propeller fold lactonase family protein [Bacteroidetes bacterium]|nr:beta-propeller fold lactonase family protein [Bacteroidota bacterium]
MNRFLLCIHIIVLVCCFCRTNAQSDQTVSDGNTTAPVYFPGTGCLYKWTNNNPGIGLPANGTGNIAAFTAVNKGNSPVKATVNATPVSSSSPPFAYITNTIDKTVSVIDPSSNKIVATIPVGSNPIGVAVSQDGARVYTANQGSDNVSVINTATNQVISTISLPLGSEPSGICVSPDGTKVYTTDWPAASFSVINTATNTVAGTFKVSDYPWGIESSPDGSRLYLGCGNGVVVVDASTYSVIANIPTPIVAQGIAVSPDGSRIYVTTYWGNSVTVISTATNTVVNTINTGMAPDGIAISPDGSKLYTANANSNSVSVISTSAGTVIATIPVGALPEGISVTPDGSKVFVAISNANAVSVIDASTNIVTGTIAVGHSPFAFGNFITGHANCSPVTFSITVNPSSVTPTITAGPVTGYASTCVLTPSVSPHIEQFTVTGSGLTGGITATAPTGFEISLSAGAGYGPSVTVPLSGGSVSSAVVYVRAAASKVIGGISGNVILSSPGTTAQDVAVMGFVNFPQTVDNVPNKVYNNGDIVPAISFTGTADSYQWSNNNLTIGLTGAGAGNIASFQAVNTGSSPVTATVTVTPTPSDFAYVDNYGSNNVSVIATVNNTVVATIPVGTNPWGVAVSPDNSRVYVTNQGSNNVSVINTATRSVIATIGVGVQPEGIVVNNDGTKVYVANAIGSTISVISTVTNAVIATINPGAVPREVSLSPDGSRLYVVNDGANTVSVINTTTNAIVATIPVGKAPFSSVMSSDGSKLYVTNYAGNSVSVINTATNAVTTTIPVGTNPDGLALSPDGTRLYVSNSNSSSVTQINTLTNSVVKTFTTPINPQGISVSPDGTLAYVINFTGDVKVLSTTTGQVLATIPAGTNPVSFGNFIVSSTGCANTPITFTITVNPSANAPTIMAGTVTGTISACYGSASVSPDVKEFTVSGSNLSSNVTVTAPNNFEISQSAKAGFGKSLVLNVTAGSPDKTVIYIRSAASAPAGKISGNITLTSGTISKVVPVAGTINAPPMVNPVGNQTVVTGAQTTAVNFTGTAGFYSWANNNPAIGLPASGTGSVPAFSAVNTGTGSVTATITVTPMLARNEAFIAGFNGNSVAVINTETNKIIATIPVGKSPLAVVASPDGARAYALDANSYDVSVINTATNTVIATIPVGQVPQDAAVSPDSKTVYVINGGENSISVIDAATNTVKSTITIDSYPSRIAISPDGSKLYVTYGQDGSVVSVVSTATGALVTDVPVGLNYYGVAVTPDGSKVYAANHTSGDVTVINTAANTVAGTYPIGGTPWNIMISPDGKEVYEANESLGKVTVISTATNTVVGQWGDGIGGDWGISVSPDGSRVYMVYPGNAPGTNPYFPSHVSVYDGQTGDLITDIPSSFGARSMHNFVTSGPGCVGTPITFTITVTQPVLPSVTTSGTLSPLITTYGTPSASASFTVSGANLKEGILATPPPGFEISADNHTFGPTAMVGAAGNVNSATVYVRLAATTPVGTYTASIVLSTNGAEPIEVIIPASMVNPAPLIITADDKTKAYGTPNPAFTFSYHTFVNGESPANLTSPAMGNTIATATSAPGVYTIVVNGVADSNYTIKYNNGTLTVTAPPISVVIPNTFTPNGDGVNDFWDIGALTSYPQCLVSIFTRYGSLVFQSKGYPKPWDGTYMNSPVPTGTYYYIIDLQNGSPLLSGFVAVVR